MNGQSPVLRAQAWQNLLAITLKVAVARGLVTLSGAPFENAVFEFEVAGLPVVGCISDAGYDELSVHAIVDPTELGRSWACVAIFHQRPRFGAAIALGWFNLKCGRFLRLSGGFHASNAIMPQLAGLNGGAVRLPREASHE
jgi:hypothetical protein